MGILLILLLIIANLPVKISDRPNYSVWGVVGSQIGTQMQTQKRVEGFNQQQGVTNKQTKKTVVAMAGWLERAG